MRRKVRTFTKLLLLGILFLAVVASAQDYRIRAKVDLVLVPVTVKGSDDKPVSGLGKDDFIVFEDGRRQTISNFSNEPVPLSAAVVVDTGLAQSSLEKIQQTFSALTGSFSQSDELAVYRYDKFVTKVLDFSGDADQIAIAMTKIRDVKPDTQPQQNAPGGPFSIPGPVINGVPIVPPGQLGLPPTTTPHPYSSKILNDALFTAASDLAKRERSRRRIVLVISDGRNSGNSHSFDETRKNLLKTDVQVYAIGLDQPFPFKKFSVLDDYAKATGGDVFFAGSTQDIERSYGAAVAEARNQYVLGYLSSNEIRGSGPIFRDIDVQIASGNLKVIHRKGYYQYP